jgi:hypothetical protein
MDFDRMPYLHHNPSGIDFGGRARLTGYEMNAPYDGAVAAGERLTVTLSWAEPAPNLAVETELVTPADPHPAFAPPPLPLAQAGTPIDRQTIALALPVPDDAASGSYYVRLRVFDGKREIRAVNTRGQTLGSTYLRPVRVDQPRPGQNGEPGMVRFGEHISLSEDVRVESDGASWQVALTWRATAPIPVNYTCSVHVLSGDGSSLAQRDYAEGPGYGFWPTSAWPVDTWWTDRLRIPFPPGIQAEDARAVGVVLYDRSQPDYPSLGSAIVPLEERARRYEIVPMARQIDATFGDQLRLLGYDLGRDKGSLRLALLWQALRPMHTDGIVFVHLIEMSSEAIVAQWDARPQAGTYPTYWWHPGEVVDEVVTLDLADVPPGTYRLALGVYNAGEQARWPVVQGFGGATPDGRLILEEPITVPERQKRSSKEEPRLPPAS